MTLQRSEALQLRRVASQLTGVAHRNVGLLGKHGEKRHHEPKVWLKRPPATSSVAKKATLILQPPHLLPVDTATAGQPFVPLRAGGEVQRRAKRHAGALSTQEVLEFTGAM